MTRLRGHAHRPRPRPDRDRPGGAALRGHGRRSATTTRLRGDAPDRAENLETGAAVGAGAGRPGLRAHRRPERDDARASSSARSRRSPPSAAASRWSWSPAGLVHDPRLRGFRRVVTESRRANVALYFLDARGLVAAPSDLERRGRRSPLDFNDLGTAPGSARREEASEGSDGLAADTGGFCIENRNDLARRAARASARESAQLLPARLRARPTSAADGRFRKIEVKVARPGVEGARAPRLLRAGRRRAPPQAPRRATPPSSAPSTRPSTCPSVPLRATAHVFGEAGARARRRVLVTAEADIRAPRLRREGRARPGTRSSTCWWWPTATTGEFHSLRPAVRDELPAGDARALRADLVPDHARARRSRPAPTRRGSWPATRTAAAWAASPTTSRCRARAGLRISTPVLSDRLREAPAPEARAPEPIARRDASRPRASSTAASRSTGRRRTPATGQPERHRRLLDPAQRRASS